jgi:hypothetical protein
MAYKEYTHPHHASSTSTSNFLLLLSIRPKRTTLMLSILTLLLFLVYFHRIPYAWPSRLNEPSTRSHWAQYSPYAPVDMYTPLPRGCQVVQANIVRFLPLRLFYPSSHFISSRKLQRHGARFPTSSASTRIKSALTKLQSAIHKTDNISDSGRLKWIEEYVYDLGENDLVSFGAAE